jgi:hypothetical protein
VSQAINANFGPHDARHELESDLRRVRALANLLDARFSIAGVRFGLDAIIGLVPGAGDLVSAALGSYPIYLAHKHGLKKRTMARMLFNLGVDCLVGLVPLVGDLADVAVKANLKNLRIFEEAISKR